MITFNFFRRRQPSVQSIFYFTHVNATVESTFRLRIVKASTFFRIVKSLGISAVFTRPFFSRPLSSFVRARRTEKKKDGLLDNPNGLVYSSCQGPRWGDSAVMINVSATCTSVSKTLTQDQGQGQGKYDVLSKA